MSASACAFNRSLQHTRGCASRGSVANEVRTSNLLRGRSETLMWERWRKGESLQQIALLFDRNHSSIQRILSEAGGIQPASRRRSRLALNLAEREEISRGVVCGRSIRSISAALEGPASTVSGEVKRNGGSSNYRAGQADQAPGTGPVAPRFANWLTIGTSRISWPRS